VHVWRPTRRHYLDSLSLAHNPSTPVRVLRKLAWSFNLQIVAAVAGNPGTPASSLLHIARWHTKTFIIERIPHNPNVNGSVLVSIARRHSIAHPSCLLAVVQHPECPQQIIHDICGRRYKGGYLAAEWLAQSESTRPEDLLKLYSSWEEPAVRNNLAGNRNTPRRILLELLNSTSSQEIYQALCKNPALAKEERVLAALQIVG